jgi:hypothetical protein
MPFPELVPTSRSFDPGNWPVKQFRSQNGAEVRILYGNRRTGMELALSYSNVTDAQAELFLDHFEECKGTFLFTGDAGAKRGWRGNSDALGAAATGNRWRYAEPPQVESIRPGRSNVSVKLVGVL